MPSALSNQLLHIGSISKPSILIVALSVDLGTFCFFLFAFLFSRQVLGSVYQFSQNIAVKSCWQCVM